MGTHLFSPKFHCLVQNKIEPKKYVLNFVTSVYTSLPGQSYVIHLAKLIAAQHSLSVQVTNLSILFFSLKLVCEHKLPHEDITTVNVT